MIIDEPSWQCTSCRIMMWLWPRISGIHWFLIDAQVFSDDIGKDSLGAVPVVFQCSSVLVFQCSGVLVLGSLRSSSTKLIGLTIFNKRAPRNELIIMTMASTYELKFVLSIGLAGLYLFRPTVVTKPLCIWALCACCMNDGSNLSRWIAAGIFANCDLYFCVKFSSCHGKR